MVGSYFEQFILIVTSRARIDQSELPDRQWSTSADNLGTRKMITSS
jgi:hypothetical protein